MIGMLSGIIRLKNDPYVLIDVHGVGYKVLVPTSVLSSIHSGETHTVYTYTHVREDVLELYGFSTPEDLVVFELLIGVSGVGCKTALGVFSVGDRGRIIQAVTQADVTFFSSVPRLGKKNAQKIIIELKNKLGGMTDLDLSSDAGGEQEDVIAVLKQFGFSQKESQQALSAVAGKAESAEEKIRLALQYLGK
jgi:Holliday junction DNA helicase RuvA